jgi:hypothetical protein
MEIMLIVIGIGVVLSIYEGIASWFREKRNLKIKVEVLESNIARYGLENKAIVEKRYNQEQREKRFESEKKIFEEKEKAFEHVLSEKSRMLVWLPAAYADYLTTLDLNDAARRHISAPTAAERLKNIAQDKRMWIKRCKVAEYNLAYYETLFPWLTELREVEEEDIQESPKETEASSKDDPARHWLTESEYRILGSKERNQLALDRYLTKRKKSNWELGRDYERFVGYLYETEGYEVKYQGILEGFEDLGRDLICRRGSEVVIVQCKYWAGHKVIHEKHINQLFGTAITFAVQNGFINPEQLSGSIQDIPVKAKLVTSTGLSDMAKNFATLLRVDFQERLPLSQYPIIKCNINRTTGERIYHLPFDQQYDKAQIKHKGEFYAITVKEAEDAGFRHAFHWMGNEVGAISQ